jgi:hypothetical protein
MFSMVFDMVADRGGGASALEGDNECEDQSAG